jgi:hypothetical protein
MAQNPRRRIATTKLKSLSMKVALSSVSPNGPTITHYDLTKLEVCVAVEWSTTEAIEFAESRLHCLNNYHWTTIESHEHTLELCPVRLGFQHLTLIMEPVSDNTAATDSTLALQEPAIHARVIINIEDTRADNILKTADSIQLLSEYLQVKGAAAKARADNHYEEASKQEAIAEQLNSRLLAQFDGTLVFV